VLDTAVQVKGLEECTARVSMLEPSAWRVAAALVPVVFIAALLVHIVVLERFPNSGDEFAYLWQASAFAAHEVTDTTPAPKEAFRLNHVGDINGMRFSKYPPGWPLLLAAGVALGAPGLVNPLLAALALAGIYRLGVSWIGRRAALLGALVTGVSPFFLLNAGSYHSHPSSLFAITALALCLQWGVERPTAWPLLLAGASFALAVLIRPYTAFLLGVPLAVAFAPALLLGRDIASGGSTHERTTHWLAPVWFGLGGLPFLLFLMFVNRAVTGSWWLLPWTYFDASERLGFGPYGHTFMRGVRIAIRLCAEGVLYTSFYGAALLAFAWGQRVWRERLLWVLLAAPVVGYIFWWSNGGNRYGPRFYFEALLPFTLLAGVGLDRLSRRPDIRAIAVGCGCLSACVFAALALVNHREIHARRDLYRTVEAAGLKNAVVLVTTGSGDMVRIDLTRNLPDVAHAAVLYGLSREDLDRDVQRAYPGRTIYRYRTTPTGGVLSPVKFE
jgi:hypothetical protein